MAGGGREGWRDGGIFDDLLESAFNKGDLGLPVTGPQGQEGLLGGSI